MQCSSVGPDQDRKASLATQCTPSSRAHTAGVARCLDGRLPTLLQRLSGRAAGLQHIRQCTATCPMA
eukprot:9114137-Alexandrium_andersonii.AAC.1